MGPTASFGAMSFANPPVNLQHHCSIIFNDTLYVYTPTAFLSLPLKRNAKWNRLGLGHSVEGGACVKGSVDGNPANVALFVVGGKSTSSDYPGLQRYSFHDDTWHIISPTSKDIQNRTDHSAIYIEAAASILVYAGSQNGDTNPSTQSFMISIHPPYTVQSYNSYVPPAYRPTLLPWSADRAVMVGGGLGNTKVFSFSAAEGWHDTGASLASPLPDRAESQCAMISGADGSKILEIFDMNVSPNQVRRYAMLLEGGVPAPPDHQVGAGSNSKFKRNFLRGRRRDITLASYPKYNDTWASTDTRTGFSLAQDANGLVVISGGDKQQSIAVFDQSTNSWLNASHFFGTTRTSSPTSTSTPSSTAATITDAVTSTTATAQPSLSSVDATNSSNKRTLTIIGATLGALLGLAALLIIVLLLLGWKKRKNKHSTQSQSKRRLGADDTGRFEDQGMEPLTRSVQPMARGPVPSADSWAIVTGQANESVSRPPFTSFDDLLSSNSPKIHSPLRNAATNLPGDGSFATTSPELSRDMRSVNDVQPGDRFTDEGWGKYFQANNQLSGYGNGSVRSTTSSQRTMSDYRNSAWPHSSAEIPALSVGIPEEPRPFGKVTSGSPSTEHTPDLGRLVAQHGLKAKISSADSLSIASDDAYGDGLSDVRGERVASSTYSASLYQPTDSNSFAAGERESNHPMTQWHRESRGSDFLGELSSGPAPFSSDISWLNLGKSG